MGKREKQDVLYTKTDGTTEVITKDVMVAQDEVPISFDEFFDSLGRTDRLVCAMLRATEKPIHKKTRAEWLSGLMALKSKSV